MLDMLQRWIGPWRSRAGGRAVLISIAAAILVATLQAAAAWGEPGVRAILVAPFLPDAPRAAQARGVFYRQTLLVNLTGQAIELASSSDGRGPLCTDDQATLTFKTGGRMVGSWSHRFSAQDRRAIVCIQPQRLDLGLAPGRYEISIELEDLYPDTYGSTAYYLISGAGNSAMPGAVGSPTPLLQPVVRSTPVDRVQMPVPMSAQPHPTATLVRVSIGRTAGPAAPSPTASRTRDMEGSVPRWSPFSLALIAGMLLLGVLALARIRGRSGADRAPTLTGVLYLFDRETREARTAILSGDARRIEVRRRPLNVVAVPAQDRGGVVVVRIWSTSAGPMFHDLTDAEGAPARLEHDLPHMIAGTIELRYRGQHTSLGPRDTARAHAERWP